MAAAALDRQNADPKSCAGIEGAQIFPLRPEES